MPTMLVTAKKVCKYPVPLYVLEEITLKCYTTKQGQVVNRDGLEVTVHMRPLTLQEKAMYGLSEVRVSIVLLEQPDGVDVTYEASAEHFPPSRWSPSNLLEMFISEYQTSAQAYSNNWHSSFLRQHHQK